MTNETMEKLNNLLIDEKELFILKGKMFNPKRAERKGTNEKYYTFCLKTLKKSSDDEYGQSFNMYHVIMPVDLSSKYSDEDIKLFKDNEVICLCSTNASYKKLPNSGAIVNNINVFIKDIMLVREISKTPVKTAINL